MYSTIILLAISYVTAVQSQTWGGIFQVNAGCSVSSCCCPIGNLNVIIFQDNTLSINVSLTGSVCSGMTNLYRTDITVPSGYVISMQISIVTFTITLSGDSNTITIANSLMPACTVASTRIATTTISGSGSTTSQVAGATTHHSNAAKKYADYMMLFSLAFTCTIIKI